MGHFKSKFVKTQSSLFLALILLSLSACNQKIVGKNSNDSDSQQMLSFSEITSGTTTSNTVEETVSGNNTQVNTVTGSGKIVSAIVFTNVGSGPSAYYLPNVFDPMIFQAINNGHKVVGYRVATSWPGNDPHYTINSTDLQSIANYYGVTSTPIPFLGGDLFFTNDFNQNAIDVGYAEPPKFSLSVSHTIIGNKINVSVAVKSLSQYSAHGSMRLRIIGIKDHYLRKTISNTNILTTNFTNTWQQMYTSSWTVNTSSDQDVISYGVNQISVAAELLDDGAGTNDRINLVSSYSVNNALDINH